MKRVFNVMVVAVLVALSALPVWAEDYAMPYVSMGYEITNDTSGVFLTYDSQLAFPGYTLEDVLEHDFFGYLTGANMTATAGFEGGLHKGRYIESWTNAQDKIEKVLFSVNSKWHGTSKTYTKAVVVLLTNGVDGVYATVPEGGACNAKGKGPDVHFATFNDDGTIKYLEGYNKTLAMSDTEPMYGCRGLTMTRFMPEGVSMLAFKGATIDEIRNHSFTGYTCGQSNARAIATGYNVTMVEGEERRLRVEFQNIHDGHCKCVIVEFTDGTDGVYAKVVKARYKTGAELGYKFVNADGSYNGNSRTIARDFWSQQYGVFAIRAVAPADIATAHWTGLAGDGDAKNPQNWACTNSLGQAVKDAIPTDGTSLYLAQPMTANLDWTALGAVRFGEGLIDLNGWRLAVASLAETAASVLITNAVEGAGDLMLTSGTTKLLTNLVFRAGVTVTVGGAATLDENGVIDMPLGVRLENGATLTNTGAARGYNKAQFMGGLQVADGATAYIDTPNQFAFTGTGYATMPVDLGSGGTLVKKGKGKISFQNASIVGTGTIRLEEGEINLGNAGLAMADTVTLDLHEHDTTDTYLWIQVTCEIPRITGNGHIAATSGGLTVTKHFSGLLKIGQKGGGNQFKTSTLTFVDGMTLDLTGVDGAWTQHAKMAYAADAKIAVDLTDRELVEGDKVISWSRDPTTGNLKSKGAPVYFVRKSDGLYAAETPMLFVR